MLLITDIDALLPTPAEPVATLILAELRKAVAALRAWRSWRPRSSPTRWIPGCGHRICAIANSA